MSDFLKGAIFGGWVMGSILTFVVLMFITKRPTQNKDDEIKHG